ncbi:MAG: DUF4097 family beta strand repeat protein [Bryobacterales bacterium]|nr:DUF4097 family beta strand repeat protein [Bryobacterales bacterium]
MKQIRLLMFPLLAMAAFAAEQKFDWQGAIAPGQTFEVKGVNGAVRAHASQSGLAEVVATKRGRKNNPEEVRIDVIPHSGGITICAVYPAAPGKPSNECKPGDGGRMNVRDNDVVVDFEVLVPADVKLVAKTVNGAVEVGGVTADIVATTVNGKVEVSGSRNVEATTVNGGVTASMGATTWTGEHKFTTVNGSINVELPESASTEIHASTVNGSIHSDLPLIIKGKISSRSLDATIGEGGRSLKLTTVNGSIHLSRRKEQ